jgi:hypothetical protein
MCSVIRYTNLYLNIRSKEGTQDSRKKLSKKVLILGGCSLILN